MTFGDYVTGSTCPACGEQGQLFCDIGGEPELQDDVVRFAAPRITAYPYRFECPVCDLDLNGEEIQQAQQFPPCVMLESLGGEEWSQASEGDLL